MRRSKRWLTVGILVLALAFRVIYLESRGLEYDDAFSILLADRSLSEIVAGTAADTMPPLYYFLLHFWMKASQQLAYIRLLNIGLSLGVVIVSVQIGKRVGGDAVGWTAGFLTAVSPLQIFHAQGMRMYVLLTLATLAYIWFLLRLLTDEEDSTAARGNWAGLVLSGVAAIYSHNLAIFGLAAPNLVLLFQRRWRLFTRLILAQLVIGLLALPWLVLVPGQIAKIQAAFWTPRPGLLEVVQTLVTFHTNLPVPAEFLVFALLISAWILVFTIVEVRRSLHEPTVQLLLGVGVLPPIFLFIVSYLMRPVFVPRAMMASSVAYYVLLSCAIARTRVQGIGVGVGLAFVLSALVVLPAQYSFSDFPRSPFKEATAYLAEEIASGELIVHDNKLSFFPALIYERALPQRFLPDAPGSHNYTLAFPTQRAMQIFPETDIAAAVGDAEGVWYVVFARALEEYQALGKSSHPQLAWLEANLALIQQINFNDLVVYEFHKR